MNFPEPGFARSNPLLERRPDHVAVENDPVQVRSPARHRVLFVINSLEGGGAERVFSALVNNVQAHLDTAAIEVLLLDHKPGRFEIDAGINVRCLNSNGSLLDSAMRFRRHLAISKPHLVVSFLPRANYLAAAFAPFYHYRSIISERSDTHGRIGSGIAGWFEKRMLRVLYPAADRVICVAEGIRRSLVRDFGVAPENVCAIHNPFDLDQLDAFAQQPSVLQQDPRTGDGFILAVGRLTQVKRFDLLIRAYALGNVEQPLVILGEGPLLGELQALAQSLGVAQRVLFPGFVANPYAEMARASVFVLCSDREGFPNGLVEAMATGCPVIATNCNHGPAEILDDMVAPAIDDVHEGEYGLLVPPGDVEALGNALHRVLTNDSLRRALADSARLRASHFTATAAIARYAAVINEQLALIGRARG